MTESNSQFKREKIELESTLSKVGNPTVHINLDQLSGQWDPDTVPLYEFYASMYVLLELVAREVKTQIAGLTVINDVSGFGIKHMGYMI